MSAAKAVVAAKKGRELSALKQKRILNFEGTLTSLGRPERQGLEGTGFIESRTKA